MTDQEHKKHIEDCGLLMTAAYIRYEATHCFNDRAEADAWRMRMEAAIAARSPAQIEFMEFSQGIG